MVCGVDQEMWALPRLVFPGDHFLPSWHSQSSYVGDSRFHTPSMLFRIRTLHFDFDRAYLNPICDAPPGIARDLKWIDRVRNHRLTETEIILSNRVANPIPRIIQGLAKS